jgi:hypothetical protein
MVDSRADKIGPLEVQVFFATSCTPEAETQAAQEFPFYELIAKGIEDTGINVFLPHRDVPRSFVPSEVYNFVRNTILKSQLVLADVATPSIDAGMMIGIAYQSNLPFVPFYRANREVDQSALEITSGRPEVKIHSAEQGVRDIVSAVKNFYGKP